MVEKPGLTWKMKLDFADMPRSGQDVLTIADLQLGYGDTGGAGEVDLHLSFGERVALIGPNGAARPPCCAASPVTCTPWAGEVRLGRGVRLGYMAQEQETLDLAATPLALMREPRRWTRPRRGSFLHYFLFAGDEVFIPVGQLSFGERSRLALALLAVPRLQLPAAGRADQPPGHPLPRELRAGHGSASRARCWPWCTTATSSSASRPRCGRLTEALCVFWPSRNWPGSLRTCHCSPVIHRNRDEFPVSQERRVSSDANLTKHRQLQKIIS